MNTYKFPFPVTLTYEQCARAEARLRSLPAVAAVCIGQGYVKIMTRGGRGPLLRALLSLGASAGGSIVERGLDGAKHTRQVLSPVAGGHNQVADDIELDFQAHRRDALLSLGLLAAFELLKRLNPTWYAASTLLRSAAVLMLSLPLFKTGLKEALAERRPNADTLTVTAVLASVAAGKPGSSLTLLTLSNFAEMLTTLAARRARSSISDLVALDEREVWVVDKNGSERRIPLEEVKPGMLVTVHMGEKICVDGTVTKGQAAVDQSAITGESIPAGKRKGDKAYAGSVVALGELTLKVEKVGDDTSLARIVHMVEDANSRRAPIQHYADKMAAALVPVSFLAAMIVFVATRDVQRVLNMLFIDFSCGLKLSTATAISAAISRAARAGILVKGGSFIEQAAAVNTLVLDKTGTITKGHPVIVKIASAGSLSENTLLKLAASAELHSSHPMATAIMEECRKRRLSVPDHLDTDTVVARGVVAHMAAVDECEGGEVLVGSQRFMQEREVKGSLKLEASGPTSSFIYIAVAGQLQGVLEIDDPVRDDFKRAINRLRFGGVEEIVMLTGDNRQVARSIAETLGLDNYKAEVMPEDKAAFVRELQRQGGVLMVGDGINDAPALAYADIGVAMGTGCTDTAMETADVTINSEDPLKLPEFVGIGRRTMTLVHQNFAVTIAVNTVAMMLGALGMITPLWASAVHNASTLGVVLNSARVLIDENRKAKGA